MGIFLAYMDGDSRYYFMKANTRLTIKIYLDHVKKYKISAILTFLSVIFTSAIAIIIPLYYKSFFDILAGSPSRTAAVPSLIRILVYIAFWELASWILWRVATYAAAYFESGVCKDLAVTCFKYLHKHSFSFFSDTFVGSLVKKINRFTRSFETISDRIIFNLLTLVVNIVIILGVLSWRNLWLGVGLVIWIAVFMSVNLLFVFFKLKYDLQRSEADTKVSGILADTITNNVNLKLFNGYGREVKNFGGAAENLKRLRLLTWNLGNLSDAIQGFLSVVLEVGIFYLAIGLWRRGMLTVGDFVLIQSYLIMIFMRIWDFGRMIKFIYEDLADAEEMTVILNAPHEIKDIAGASVLKVKQGKIDFVDVCFNYNETRPVISHLNLEIKPKEKVALVGPSGSGKTTIVRLLLRMHDVTSGKILIDGQKISKVTQESLWENISMVPQDPILFHRSLLENIRYGKPEATDTEVIRAAKLAHCHEFINEFPDGYLTYVGERGIKLSGGEKQRVAIARAILCNAPILVLDEATSSLDSESERLIQDALDTLIKGKTVIVIAHRLSTIMKMDRIIVISRGKIAEEGTHAELLKNTAGIYSRLWRVQAGGFIK